VAIISVPDFLVVGHFLCIFSIRERIIGIYELGIIGLGGTKTLPENQGLGSIFLHATLIFTKK
jgi:hypothetical protein